MVDIRNRSLHIAGLLLVAASVFLLGPTVNAQAAYVHKYDATFDTVGSAIGVTVDDQSSSVYVLNGEGLLQKFDAAGNPSDFSATGTNTLHVTCEASCTQMAVDNSGDANQGVIYVAGGPFWGPEVFVYLPSGEAATPFTNSTETPYGPCGVSVDAAGQVYVAHWGFFSFGIPFLYPLVDRLSPSQWSTHPSQEPTITATLRPIPFNQPCLAAAAPDGSIYLIPGSEAVTEGEVSHFAKATFGAPGTEASEAPKYDTVLPSATSIAIDQQSGDLYADTEAGVTRLTSSDETVESFTSADTTSSHGVAVNSQTKTVYTTNYSSGKVAIFKKFDSPEISNIKASTGVGEATLSGHVDPAGAGDIVSCGFEYKLHTEPTYTQIPCEPSPPYEDSTDVSATVTGLAEGVEYDYRLAAANANAASASGVRTFSIKPPTIEGFYASELGETTATLNARINTFGAATEYHFEYGTSISYGSSAPLTPGKLDGGATVPQLVSVPVSGLEPHTVYHFRVVAVTPVGMVTSEDQTFNFFPPTCPNSAARQQSGSDYLPDCRAYELVSPGRMGNVLLVPDAEGPPATYATNPARFSYDGLAGGISGTEPFSGFGTDRYVATRTSTGWVTTLPGVKGSETSGFAGVPGVVGDLGLDRFLDLKGSPEASIPYIFNADGTLYSRWPATYKVIPNAEKTNGFFQPSPDFDHLAFSSSNVAFTPNGVIGAPGSAYDYDPATGTTSLISRLPNGGNIPQEASNKGTSSEIISFPGAPKFPGEFGFGPKNPATVNPGLSTDGSHILMATMSAPPPSGSDPVPAVHLYMRVDDAVTYDVSAGAAVADYVGMTKDGSKVFFTSVAKLTSDDEDTSRDLYMWEEEKAANSEPPLVRLSTGSAGAGNTDACNPSWTEKCGVQPIMVTGGLSADTGIAAASGEIYFYSPEQLDGSRGTLGARNIYVYREGSPHYVATGTASRMNVSTDGSHMALVTTDRLTAYDNHSFSEMYTYDPRTGLLKCVSCDPTGAPPIADTTGSFNGLFMSEDGRTFFYTINPLVPQDTNKLGDVYEFVDGRPQLITTGTSAHDKTASTNGYVHARAGFSGVSADGVNVYFATFDSLVSTDENGEFLKIYDARTGGGFPVASPRQPCVAADECHGATNPTPGPSGIVSDGDLGAGGNVMPAKKHGQRRRSRGKKHHRRHHKHGRAGNRRHHKHGRAGI